MNEETATTEQTEQGPEVRRLDNQIQQLCKQVTESEQKGKDQQDKLRDLERQYKAVGNELGKIERRRVKTAFELGRALIERKEMHGHGPWGAYVKRLPISQSSATDYMRIAREIDSAANLKDSIRATLDLIKMRKDWERQKQSREQQAKRDREGVEARARVNREAFPEAAAAIEDAVRSGKPVVFPVVTPARLREYAEHTVEMNSEDDPLPETVAECHEMILDLRREKNDLATALSQVAAEKNEMMQERDR